MSFMGFRAWACHLALLLCAQGGLECDEVVLAQIHYVNSNVNGNGHANLGNVPRPRIFKYGFYLHTYSEPVACVNLLRQVRYLYPHEPVYVMSDGGLNFTGICNEIGNCKFEWKPPANDRWNPVPFLNRFREAATWLNSQYIIMLEPDNELRWKIEQDMPDDAGGVNDFSNGALKLTFQDYLSERGRNTSGNREFKLKWDRFGLCGGSYFRTQAVLESFYPESLDWATMGNLSNKRIWSSDVAMAVALAAHGFSYYPWGEVTQARYGLSETAALRHYGRDEGKKPGYGEPLRGKDTHLVTVPSFPVGKVTCQGCVWVSDEVCWQQKGPVACPTDQAKLDAVDNPQ